MEAEKPVKQGWEQSMSEIVNAWTHAEAKKMEKRDVNNTWGLI